MMGKISMENKKASFLPGSGRTNLYQNFLKQECHLDFDSVVFSPDMVSLEAQEDPSKNGVPAG